MRTKVEFPSFAEVLTILAGLRFDVRGFDVRALPGVAGQGLPEQVFVEKYGAGAILARRAQPHPLPKNQTEPSAVWIERPGFLVGGEVATLLDRGYQKFWKTARVEVPATADSLKAVHRFAEELREAVGEPSLYNESLGTTSDVYLYDRVQGRDLPPAERPKRAWDLASSNTPVPGKP